MLTLVGKGHNLLVGFMSDHDPVARDLPFHGSIGHTYERDDGLSRSWIDHVMCSRSFSTLVTDVFARHSGSNLSDHSPLHFLLHVQGQSILQSPLSSSPSNSKCTKVRCMKVDGPIYPSGIWRTIIIYFLRIFLLFHRRL